MTDKKIVILGSTGSVGRQTVEVAADLGVSVTTLAASSDYKTMENEARILHPRNLLGFFACIYCSLYKAQGSE